VRVGLDTNVLVYTHLASTDLHHRVRGVVQGLLQDRSSTLVVTSCCTSSSMWLLILGA
jgi:hypothetical protein